MKDMLLTIDCQGHFAAHFTGDAKMKCDLAHIAVYHYKVEITATNESLSPEGFIIENSRVHSYFIEAYAKPVPVMSCEKVAMKAAEDLGEMLKAENISVVSVKATITGSNGALLSAEWKNLWKY